MHQCPENWVAIGNAAVYYAWAAHAFSADIKCSYCIFVGSRLQGAEVWVGNNLNDNTFDPGNPDDLKDFTQCGVIPDRTERASYEIECPKAVEGTWVVVLFRDGKRRYISLCEIAAFSDHGTPFCIESFSVVSSCIVL